MSCLIKSSLFITSRSEIIFLGKSNTPLTEYNEIALGKVTYLVHRDELSNISLGKLERPSIAYRLIRDKGYSATEVKNVKILEALADRWIAQQAGSVRNGQRVPIF